MLKKTDEGESFERKKRCGSFKIEEDELKLIKTKSAG
jgi:hypothetical protein